MSKPTVQSHKSSGTVVVSFFALGGWGWMGWLSFVGGEEIVAANADMKDCLLFGHAWAECDTTSAISQKGKFIKKYS